MIKTLSVWKYGIPFEENFTLELPAYHKILKFGLQGNYPVIWVLVTPGNPVKTVSFKLIGTAKEFQIPVRFTPDSQLKEIKTFEYIGTIQMVEGNLVFHLFKMFM